MTEEKFERACELKSAMESIGNLQDLFSNAKGTGLDNKYLAAINMKEEGFDTSGYVVKECKVINHMKVPYGIMTQLENVLRINLETLQKEFEEL